MFRKISSYDEFKKYVDEWVKEYWSDEMFWEYDIGDGRHMTQDCGENGILFSYQPIIKMREPGFEVEEQIFSSWKECYENALMCDGIKFKDALEKGQVEIDEYLFED